LINDKYSGVILVLEDIDKLKDIDGLMTYVFDGGNVFFAYRLGPTGNFYSIHSELGIYDFGDFLEASGIRLTDNILIKGTGFEVNDKIVIENSSIGLMLTPDCETYAESIEGTPLLWKKKYGKGNIVYFNGTMLEDKMSLGFSLGAISLLQDDFVYPIINSKINFIDDFPAPFPQGTHKKIIEEFNRTTLRFYKDVWWPDMLELASKYDMKYTGVVIGTYNNEVENITSDGLDLSIEDFVHYGRELINSGGELGIHGYNHQPLATKELVDKSLNYKPWKNKDVMIDSIEEINKLSKKAFPQYDFRVYVPPSNILYPEGREAILESSSDLKIISSLYITAGDEDAYVQDFDISKDGTIEFPRLTSGYMNSEETQWVALNGINLHGVFSHFVHPDDLLDYKRTGNKGWIQLLKEYDEFNKMIFDKYRWLRGMTASEGANEMIKYLRCEPKYEMNDRYTKIYCNHFQDKIYFVLRTKKEIKSVEGGNIEKIDKNIYLVECNKSICKINYKR
jgi:hypothetical protein